ncbi:hypothetical protein LOTGIDRAFT_225027 [Lottia gigantea]|uniref:Microspherule protein 1 n=1 Tax=Lottia gigantea TaxID=225164 RepID=V4AWQ0_LOTGI|nr:hypothetical protein LOTGIDRAFT_225027 [Lottia gigantea]ESP01908.1 hypothetical protein LOTGIDRAFT_225027 [Lottia gigantea]
MVTPKAPPKTTPHRNIRTPQVDPIPARRSSTRTIKRKKFDDEMVESSLYNKIDRQTPSRPKIPSLVPLATPSSSTTAMIIPVEKTEVPVIVPVLPVVPPPPVVPAPPAPIPEKKINLPPAKSSSRVTSSKDLGRWKAQDDLLLINAVQQCNDLSLVHTGVKFSCHFTLKEIQERWYALLYDQQISKLSIQTMKMLHPDIIGQVQAKALFSNREEELLGTIPSTKNPSIERFQDLVNEHPEDFYPLRTPKALHTHWLLLKQYHLLPDQSVQPMPRGDHILNFSDAEDAIHDEELLEPKDEAVEKELMVADRRCKKEIRHLEEEMPKLQCLVDNVTGISPPDFDNQTLAVLRGRLVRYLMRSKEITLGRATKDTNVDVDLSLEGPAWKISRQQGVIKLRPCGDFYLANEGKRPIYVDGKPIIKGNKQKLFHNSVVEISSLRFIFLINEELVKTMRTEIPKLIPNIT